MQRDPSTNGVSTQLAPENIKKVLGLLDSARRGAANDLLSDTQAGALRFEHPQLDSILQQSERVLPDGTPFPKNPTKAQIDAFNKQLLEDLD